MRLVPATLAAAALAAATPALAHGPHHGHAHGHARPLAIPSTRPPPPPPRAQPRPTRYTVVQRTVVVDAPTQRAPHHRADAPRFDRTNTFALSLRTGSNVGAYRRGDAFGDFSLGLAFRYRPVASFGIEAAVMHADQSWRDTSTRRHTTGQLSGIGFIAAHKRVSPYVLGGLTVTGQALDGGAFRDTLWGPHGGAGIEIALGGGWALDLDARGIGYVNALSNGATRPFGVQANAGFVAHF